MLEPDDRERTAAPPTEERTIQLAEAPAGNEITSYGLPCSASHGHDAFLRTLAHHPAAARFEVQVADHHGCGLADAQTGIECSPHVLRHTFARTFLANGNDVFSLQRILGHSPTSLEVTRRYVHLLDDDLRETHRRASPVDHLAGI